MMCLMMSKMKKILLAFVALALVASPVMAGNNKHIKRGQNHNWNGGGNWDGKHFKGNRRHGNNYNCYNCYYKKGHNNNNNNFYNDPDFWLGVGGGLLGGAIINQYQNQYELPPPPMPQCRQVMTYVWVDGLGYRPGNVMVCN